MVKHPSVAKRHRQSLKRRTRNQQVKSQLKTLIKRLRTAIEAKQKETMLQQISQLNQALSRAVSKGVVKRSSASRKLSRLARSAHRVVTEA